MQAEASDQWAYYQAKGVKAAVERASESAWLAVEVWWGSMLLGLAGTFSCSRARSAEGLPGPLRQLGL